MAPGFFGCTFQQAQDHCKTAFGAGIFGKVFEPTSIEDNDAVLKAARGFGYIFWIGVSNKPLKYKSNKKLVSISTIPWAYGEPSKTANETQCLTASSSFLKWSASYPCSQKAVFTICETTTTKTATVTTTISNVGNETNKATDIITGKQFDSSGV